MKKLYALLALFGSSAFGMDRAQELASLVATMNEPAHDLLAAQDAYLRALKPTEINQPEIYKSVARIKRVVDSTVSACNSNITTIRGSLETISQILEGRRPELDASDSFLATAKMATLTFGRILSLLHCVSLEAPKKSLSVFAEPAFAGKELHILTFLLLQDGWLTPLRHSYAQMHATLQTSVIVLRSQHQAMTRLPAPIHTIARAAIDKLENTLSIAPPPGAL